MIYPIGLQVYETISVSMAAKTSVGWGPYSNVLYFNTLEDCEIDRNSL